MTNNCKGTWSRADDIYSTKITYRHKKEVIVRFALGNVPSQCGAMFLYEFYIRGDVDNVKLIANDFRKDLKYCEYLGKLCKVIVTARVGSRLAVLMENGDWASDTSSRNPNSGNSIKIYQATVIRR